MNSIPSNWKEVVWAIASHYNFPPESIWEMDAVDLLFWSDGIEWYVETVNGKG